VTELNEPNGRYIEIFLLEAKDGWKAMVYFSIIMGNAFTGCV
jgi:hypothetical protein